MPNWCENRVTVSGPFETVAAFYQDHVELCKRDFFHSILPMPEELRGTTKTFGDEVNKELVDKYGADNWYDWANANWGTKWDVDVDSDYYPECDSMTLHFDTAWGPPAGVYKALCEMYPTLSITWFYDEPGMMFAGYLNTEDI